MVFILEGLFWKLGSRFCLSRTLGRWVGSSQVLFRLIKRVVVELVVVEEEAK